MPAWGTKVKKRSRTQPDAKPPESLASLLSKLFEQLPNLIQHMATTRYDDGTPRQPGTMMIQTMGAAWKIVLKEKDGKMEMNVVGNTLDDALVLAELYAGSDDAPWEPDNWARQQETRKKK